MEFKAYLAIGEETTRGTGQVTTVGFIPLTDFDLPIPDYMTKKRGEFRGESSRLGHTVERRRAAFAQRLDQLDDRGLALAVDDDIDVSALEHRRGHVAEKAAACNDGRTQFFGDAREPQAFHTTHRLLADADVRRLQPPQFGFQAPPAHLQCRCVKNGYAEVANLRAQRGGERGKSQRRPDGAGRPVKGPERTRRPYEQEEFLHKSAPAVCRDDRATP